MLGTNIRNARKRKGYTQEDLASRIYVTRQTVSKWEKELSVPDAEKLAALAEVLEIPVSDLLGAKVESPAEENAVVEQLARLNEQLAIKNRRAKRVWKAVIIIGIIFFVVPFLLSVFGMVFFRMSDGGIADAPNSITYECELDDEQYTVTLNYSNRYRIGSCGVDCPEGYDDGDIEEFELSFDEAEMEQRNESIEETNAFLEEVTDRTDARKVDKALKEYFEARGGTVTVTEQTGKAIPE